MLIFNELSRYPRMVYVIPGTANSVSDTNYIQNSFNVFNIIEKEKY